MVETVSTDAIGDLRERLATLDRTSAPGGSVADQIVKPKQAVFARFGLVFTLERLPELTEDEFRSFLLFENNHHWTGLRRQMQFVPGDGLDPPLIRLMLYLD